MGLGIGGLLEQLIGPPGGFILLAVLGLVLMPRYHRLGYGLVAVALALLYLASLPVVSTTLLSWLEPETVLNFTVSTPEISDTDANFSSKPSPQAIVILGAGRHYNTPEFLGDTPNEMALERIRYGVWLARRTQLPLLVTGGLGDDHIVSEAQLMKQLIESEYALGVRWTEKQSRTTFENAKFSADILKAEGIDSVYLVTHALHMKRSVMSFEKFLPSVHPAPTVFMSHSQRKQTLRHFLPSAKALKQTSQVFHEYIGMLWYWLRY